MPTSYNFVFNGYVGLYLKIFAYGYYNKNIYELSNIFFDATNTSNSGLTNLAIPFMYDEQEWGKYYEFKIPSIDYLSNQRLISNTGNTVWLNSINEKPGSQCSGFSVLGVLDHFRKPLSNPPIPPDEELPPVKELITLLMSKVLLP